MELTFPIKGEDYNKSKVSQDYNGYVHNGVDLAYPSGSKVVAVADGTVVKSDDNDVNGFGGVIRIKHDIDGQIFYTTYAHLRKRDIVAGVNVNAGQTIGESGGGPNDPNKGRSTNSHLHFVIQKSDGVTSVDPKPYLAGDSEFGDTEDEKEKKEKETDKEREDKLKNYWTTDKEPEKSLATKATDFYLEKGGLPISIATGLGGLTQTENKKSELVIEEVERIKQLMK